MINHYKLIILLLFFSSAFAQQEYIQNMYVSKSYTNVDEEWSETFYKPEILVSANMEGVLKITSVKFLEEVSDGKAKLANRPGYNSADFNLEKVQKAKTDKKGIISLTFDGMLIYNTFDGMYSMSARVIILVSQNTIIGLKIKDNSNSKEYLLVLTQKET